MSTTPRDELERRGAPPRDSSAHARLRSMVAARMFGSPPSRVGRYTIRGRLGEGGGGSVWLGHDANLDREVAIKQVHGADDDARARIVREARSLAAVSHPNVVQIYEADVHEGKPFIAMELVQGQTLAEWLEAPRSWSDVVTVMAQAGRGLAAVHDLALIHRDFKPSNIMVGDDGRVRVVDFGLARVPGTGDPSVRDGGVPADDLGITRSGTINGTPRYMAPEQLRGERATASTDQFSFCLVVNEALCGELLLPEGPAATRTRPWPRAVPRWLRRSIDRGLDVDPARRWTSMAALVQAIERRPGRRLLWGGVVAVAVTAASAYALPPARTPDCRGGATLMEDSWNETLRRRIVVANEALDLQTVNEALARSFVDVDTFAARWVDEHREACRGHRVHDTLGDEAYRARLECLEAQRRNLDVLLEAAAEPAGEDAFGTAMVLASLPDPAECATATPLAAGSEELHERGRLATLDLVEARALQETGRYEEAQVVAARGLARLGPSELPGLRAEFHEVLGWLAMSRGDVPEAERLLRDGLVEAARAGDSRATAELWLILAHVVGELDKRPREGLAMADAAELAVRALGGEELTLRARIYGKRGVMWMRLDNRAETEKNFAVARDYADRTGMLVTRILINANWAAALAHWDELEATRRLFERVLQLQRESTGDRHPGTADALVKLATTCDVQGDLDCAVRSWTEAADIYASIAGADNPDHIRARDAARASVERRDGLASSADPR